MTKAVRPKAKKVALGCYLTADELRELREYAAHLEISVPNLCSLVIQRELCKPKLSSLKRRHLKRVGRKGGERMTVWFANKAIKNRFAAHISKCKLRSGDAVGALFRAELSEQWLRRAIGWPKGFVLESRGQLG
jgi:hypothetical protein